MFTWTKEYSVGVQELDEQHQQFLVIANDVLILAIKNDVTKNEFLTALVKFSNYALYHLSTEEDYFARFGCPPPGHIEAHDKFRAVYKKYFNNARKGDLEAARLCAQSAARFAGQWLLDHILIMDKAYTKCFKEHGLQ